MTFLDIVRIADIGPPVQSTQILSPLGGHCSKVLYMTLADRRSGSLVVLKLTTMPSLRVQVFGCYHNDHALCIVKGVCIAIYGNLTTTECRLPYGITQCYKRTHPAFTPARQAGTRYTDHLTHFCIASQIGTPI